jgi:DNA adenine methylase
MARTINGALVLRYDRPHTFFYMDPPYWETEGYGVQFGLEQYEKMAEALRTMKGKAIVSLNDHPEMRRVFASFEIDVVPIKYTVGGGERTVERQELVIYSWDRSNDPPGLF